jgi:hypothetical protein
MNKSLRFGILCAVAAAAITFSNPLFGQESAETITFTLTSEVSISGRPLPAGSYSIANFEGGRTLIVTEAETHRFVAIVMPASSSDLRQGEQAAVNITHPTVATSAISSVSFPVEGRSYTFRVPKTPLQESTPSSGQ